MDVERLKELEHEGDRITHQALAKLNTTFITPFDREDIYALATRLDDILDATDAAAQRMVVYHINELPPRFLALADLLAESAKEVQKVVVALHDRKKHPRCPRLAFATGFATGLARRAGQDLCSAKPLGAAESPSHVRLPAGLTMDVGSPARRRVPSALRGLPLWGYEPSGK